MYCSDLRRKLVFLPSDDSRTFSSPAALSLASSLLCYKSEKARCVHERVHSADVHSFDQKSGAFSHESTWMSDVSGFKKLSRVGGHVNISR